MHEASLVIYILNAVEKKALQEGVRKVNKINIVTGVLRGAVPELMQHSFKTLTRRRPIFANAALEIEEREAVLKCGKCGGEYSSEEMYDITCPECGSGAYEIIKGNELYIESFEGEDWSNG